jgi:hypothetical protein
MKTFIAKDVLRDHSSGMVVVCAENLVLAKLVIADKFPDRSAVGEIVDNLVELPENGFDYINEGG